MIWGMDMAVLCGRVLSCCNLLLIIWMAGWTGTEVKRALSDLMKRPQYGCQQKLVM